MSFEPIQYYKKTIHLLFFTYFFHPQGARFEPVTFLNYIHNLSKCNFQGDDGNQYVVLEVIQLNESDRAMARQAANINDDDDDDDDEDDDDFDEDDVGGIVIKKEFDERPKVSRGAGKGKGNCYNVRDKASEKVTRWS